jgi:hypothetical protein
MMMNFSCITGRKISRLDRRSLGGGTGAGAGASGAADVLPASITSDTGFVSTTLILPEEILEKTVY